MSGGSAPAKLRESPAFKVALSLSIATGLYGVSFGALSVASGFDFWQTMVLSLLLFSGGSQFAFIGVVAGGGSGVAAMTASALLGLRNGIYGMQINAMLRPGGWKRYVSAHITIDESTATASGQSDPGEQARGFWTAGIGIFVLWNIFTAVGALAGDAMGDPKQWGLDGAAVAAFLALLWPRLKGRQPWAIAAACALATVLAVPFVPSGVPILVAAVVAGVIGWFSHSRLDEGLEPDVDPYAEKRRHGKDGHGKDGHENGGHEQDRHEKDRHGSDAHGNGGHGNGGRGNGGRGNGGHGNGGHGSERHREGGTR